MALAERAELVARLSLKDDFSGKIKAASGSLRGMEGSLGRIAGHANRGLRNAATNLAKVGAVGAGFVALNVKAGISSLAELEDAITSVDGAIGQVGEGWKITGTQIADIANEIETDVQRAFDDKAITQATETLIRYGGLAESNLRPAMEVMTDLAAKTGDVGGASTILAKALAAPEKAAGRLTRMGIVLTDQQQKQIEKMVKAGDAAGAQAELLDILAEKTEGAAAAMAGPYRDSMNILKDVTEDAQRALGEAFLPVLSKVADKLSTWLADKGNIDRIRSFGRDLAGGFDKLLTIVGNIPWAQVGDSMRIAGAGAKALFDAFTMLPPWVQTAVLTSWGLNKLTGGALGGIVGELGKGLIRGVLGINAGVVNIKAGAVTGGGGVGGAVPVGAKGGMSAVSKLFLVGEAIGLIAAVHGVTQEIQAGWKEQGTGIQAALDKSLAGPQTVGQLQMKLDAINTGIARLKADPVAAALITGPVIAELERQRTQVVSAIQLNTSNLQPLPENISNKQKKHFDRLREKTEASRIAIVNRLGNLKDTTQTLSAREQNKLDRIRAGAEANRIALANRVTTTSAAERAVLQRVRESAEGNRIATVTARNAARTDTDRIVTAIHGIDLRAQVTVSGITYTGANPYPYQPTNQTRNRRPPNRRRRRDRGG